MPDFPDKLTEMDRLTLTLLEERKARLQAESMNVRMLQSQLGARHAKLEEEGKALKARFSDVYGLGDADEVSEDGTIKRVTRPTALHPVAQKG